MPYKVHISEINVLRYLQRVAISSVLWSHPRQNLKNPEKILGQILKSQVKKEISFPYILIFKNL